MEALAVAIFIEVGYQGVERLHEFWGILFPLLVSLVGFPVVETRKMSKHRCLSLAIEMRVDV